MSNATLTNIQGRQAKSPDLKMTMNRSDLETMMAAQADLNSMISSFKVKLDGNIKLLADLRSIVVEFNPVFQIMPSTATGRPLAENAQANPFEQPESELLGE